MFMQAFYFSTGGAILYQNGNHIRVRWDDENQGTLHKEEYYIVIEFAGAGVSMLLYVSCAQFFFGITDNIIITLHKVTRGKLNGVMWSIACPFTCY